MTAANATFAYLNLADTATPTASSAGTSTPVTNLQTAPVSQVWVGTGGTADSVTLTWASDQTADTFMLAGLGFAIRSDRYGAAAAHQQRWLDRRYLR
jgi:hypothetical protein